MLATREDLCELRKFQANYQRLWRFISASISTRASGQCFAATIISSRQSVSLQSTSYRPPGGSPALLITGAPARTSCTIDPGCVLSSKQARDSAFIRIVMSYFFHRCRSRSNPDCPDQTVIGCAFRVKSQSDFGQYWSKFQLLGCFVREPFVHAHDFGTPIRIDFHILKDFLAGKHLLESASL
jgi:hypothetical protein